MASKAQDSAQKIDQIITLLLSHVKNALEIIETSTEYADKADEQMESVIVSYSEIVGLMLEVANFSKGLLESNLNSKTSAEIAVGSLNSMSTSSKITIDKSNELNTKGLELIKMGDQLGPVLGHQEVVEAGEANEEMVKNSNNDAELF